MTMNRLRAFNWAANWPLVLAGLLVAFILLVFVLGRFGFRFDPFNMAERRAETAEAEADYAVADADARGFEAEGEIASAQRVDAYTHLTIDVERMGAAAAAEARSEPDASDPVPLDRADRLRGFDRELCAAAPRVCEPAPADDASGGESPL